MLPHSLQAGVRSFIILTLFIAIQSCGGHKKYYKSDCDNSRGFKHIGFKQLIDSLQFYDKHYVEVSGKFKEGKNESELLNDSTFADHSEAKALWVEFSPDCPLYLSGTRIGFFDYDNNNGKLTPVNNKTITIRGIVNVHYKGHSGAYKGSIGHISYVKL